MGSRLVKEGVSSLWFQDVQSAVDIKGATLGNWNELQRVESAFVDVSGKRKFKGLLIEFQSRVRSVLTKCKTTQGVLTRKEDRIQKVDEESSNGCNSLHELEAIRNHMKKMAEIIVEIGEIFQEVSRQIKQINGELFTARSTFSGQTPE